MNNYQDMSGLELFGDPFSRSHTYSQAASHNSCSKTSQPKTMAVQQPKTRMTAKQPEHVNAQVQRPQPVIKPATQAKTPVPQQKSGTSVPEAKPIIPVPGKPAVPADTRPQPELPGKELVMDMSSSTGTGGRAAGDDTAKRKAHDEAEVKRKADWETEQLAKKQAEAEVIQKLNDMSDDDVITASTKRITTDVERLTRRNMKECVAAHIQKLARKDAAFARRTMHPRKNMANCFKYINRMAKDYIQQEMEDNGIKPENGVYSGDVPDGVVYQWAEDYFNAAGIEEDQEKEEKFVPKPYTGTISKTSSKPKKEASKAKKTEKQVTKEAKKNQESSSGYEQMSFV